jgi:hypothetical protein
LPPAASDSAADARKAAPASRRLRAPRTTLKGLIGEIRLIPDGEHLTAEFELEGARLLAAADVKISVVAEARFDTCLMRIPRRKIP